MKIPRTRLGLIATGALLLVFAAPAAAAWMPTTETSGVPLPNGTYPGHTGYDTAGYYQYAPSIVQTSSTQRVIYYCANMTEYDPPTHSAADATHDHVLFNVGTREPDGSYSWGSTQVALQPRLTPTDPEYHPATPAWAGYHICDPDVVTGEFEYAADGSSAHTYAWAMFFTGADDDDGGADGRFNVVGVALSDSPTGPWVIVDTPVIDIDEPDYNAAGYGVGEPSVTSVDGTGDLLLFYSGLDCAALDVPDPTCADADRGTAVRTLDLSDSNAPVLGSRSLVTTAGLTGEPFLSGKSWLHNASWAYDPSRDNFVISRDTGAYSDNEVQEEVEVDTIAGSSVWSGGGSWTVAGTITSSDSGQKYNHNSGLVRDPFGGLAYQGPLDYSGVDVYYATEPFTGSGAPPWDGYFLYRMQHTATPF